MEIKPIETIYNGYRFRSRLEARWAVFFDALEIKYQYEPEGFKGWDGESYYLPDFYFPDFKVYGEVKPSKESLYKDARKISNCIDYHATPLSDGLIVFGQIPYIDMNNEDRLFLPSFPFFHWHKGIISVHSWFIVKCFGKASFVYDDYFNMDSTSAPDLPKIIHDEDIIYLTKTASKYDGYLLRYDEQFIDFDRIREALLKARQARFEFGETPVVTKHIDYDKDIEF